MNEHLQQEFSFGEEWKLAAPVMESSRKSRALTGAVRKLADRKLGPDVRNELVRMIRRLFPELMELRGAHDAAIERKDRQVGELGPFLKKLRPLLDAGGTAPAGTSQQQHDKLIDLSTRLMWELSETEREIETLEAREAALRDRILSLVSHEHLPLVRWALTQA